jgi:hypothetical protein
MRVGGPNPVDNLMRAATELNTKQQLQLKSSKYKDINENVYTCIQVRQAQRSGSEHNIT